MSILVDKNTRLLVQGITGKAGGFHASQCREYGTNVVAGVTPATTWVPYSMHCLAWNPPAFPVMP